MNYIAYDTSLIMGIGPTPEAAIADARECCGTDDAIFETAPCWPELYALVEKRGGGIRWGWTPDGIARPVVEHYENDCMAGI